MLVIGSNDGTYLVDYGGDRILIKLTKPVLKKDKNKNHYDKNKNILATKDSEQFIKPYLLSRRIGGFLKRDQNGNPISGVHIIEVLHVINEKDKNFIINDQSYNLYEDIYQTWLKLNNFSKRFGRKYSKLIKHIEIEELINRIIKIKNFCKNGDEINFNQKLDINKKEDDRSKIISLYIKPNERKYF